MPTCFKYEFAMDLACFDHARLLYSTAPCMYVRIIMGERECTEMPVSALG